MQGLGASKGLSMAQHPDSRWWSNPLKPSFSFSPTVCRVILHCRITHSTWFYLTQVCMSATGLELNRQNVHLYYNLLRSQLLLDCLGRCLKLFVSTDSTSSHEFSSQFGLAFFYTRKTKAVAKTESRASVCWMCRSQSIDRQRQHERRQHEW